GYKAFYMAFGAQAGRMTGGEGESSRGVEPGLNFLRRVNAGEKEDLKGTAVIIGGGNVAMDVARTVLRCGAEKVEMFCLEDEAHMLAVEDEVAEAKEEGIVIHNGFGPKKINAVNGTVASIDFRKCVSTLDKEGKFAPVYDETAVESIECSYVFEAIGQGVEWGGLLEGASMELNRNQTAKADPITLQSSEPDIFVGGDVYTGPKFAIDAIAAGRQAAESIHRFVHKGQSLTLGRDLREFVSLDTEDIKVESFDNAKRQIPGRKTGAAKTSFHDLRSVFTEEQVKAEANRCLGCGASVVDVNKCIGCGLCTTRCEFDAIHLTRDVPEASIMRTAEDKMKGILPYMIKRQFKIWTNKDKK
ncbi:MAG: pyridine nucleotide-disulfide oxidoreductase, partial [Erysipelotrichia bacterium]|nr:pyridine nucleotide-disulfide oxidoreductase [Erysipelotrichia bacterium]